ncbi:hypothetical protein [Gulosibacter sediminis]|uniref:hypothetical protein n=1 Tax=Gulosibacter sediminis TaxID=1729695 RepID=UPI0024A9F7AD|nr:hypothetical protein [Gulosibacter sediminis]
MSEQRPRFSPPEPRFGAEPAADAVPDASGSSRRRVWSPLTIVLTSASAVVVIGLVITLALLWGNPLQPSQGEAAAPLESNGGGTAGPTDTVGPTPTPYAVQPGDTVSIEQDAVFEDGFTLVYPKLGDWIEQDIMNRPEQLTMYAPDYSAQIQVWQTSVFNSNQTDKELTLAQLNRINDECSSGATGISEPESYLLEGEDGTKLELLGVRADECDGGEVWLLQRVMPLTGTRVHIVLWSTTTLDDNDELLDKLAEITFTTP